MRKQSMVLVGMLALSLGATAAHAQHQQPNQQPVTAAEAAAPTGDLALGTVRIPRAVMADGKPLPAGQYQVRLTAQTAAPTAVGASPNLARWVEFVKGGKVAGREVVSIVPQSEIKMVVKDAAPAPGASKVQMLKGNDFLRVWINKTGNHFLIHLPVSAAAAQ